MTVPAVFGKGRPRGHRVCSECRVRRGHGVEAWLARPGRGAARPLGARTMLKTRHGGLVGPDLEGLSPHPQPPG